jgi:formate-dependent phosphoribosylglycinamide formyltransferase (GAR transformylase)
MIPITERLRARLEPVGDGSGKWRPDGLCQEAADVVDALVAALEEADEHIGRYGKPTVALRRQICAALAKAKGRHE